MITLNDLQGISMAGKSIVTKVFCAVPRRSFATTYCIGFDFPDGTQDVLRTASGNVKWFSKLDSIERFLSMRGIASFNTEAKYCENVSKNLLSKLDMDSLFKEREIGPQGGFLKDYPKEMLEELDGAIAHVH